MATAAQYSHGNPRAVYVPFNTADATVTFAIGDLVKLSSGNAVAQSTGAVTSFLGVAAQAKPAGTTGTATHLYGNSDSGTLRVDTDGEFWFDCADTVALEVGTMVAPASAVAVTAEATESLSIGRVAKRMAASAGRVRVKIQSALLPAAKTT